MIEAVEIAAPGGVVLRGELRQGGEDAVALVHEPARDLDAWGLLPNALGDRGLTVLAFDLRGHGGSDGEPDAATTAADTAAAVRFLRRRARGSVFVGAAGASAGPALEAALGLGALGAFALGPVGDMPVMPLPTLAVVASFDERQERAAERLRNASGSVVVAHVPVGDAGLGILGSEWGGNAEAYVCTFLNDVRLSALRRGVGAGR